MMKPQLIKVLYCFHLFILMFALSFATPAWTLTIDEAFDKAVKVDPGLRSSRFNQLATAENIVIARSRLLPQIMLQGASNQLTQTTTQDVTGGSSLSRSFTGPSVNHQFVIRQGLIRPKEMSALNLAELQTQYGDIKYLSDISDLWLRVAYAYIDLLGAQQLIEAYEKPLTNMLLAARQEKVRFEKGDGTKDAADEAESQYQQAKATYGQAVQGLQAKQRSFELLTQIDPIQLKDLKLSLRPEPKLMEQDREQVWQRVKEKSFELRLAVLQEAMQKERLRMARADHLPTLDAIAAWNIAKNDATSTQGYKYKNNQIGMQYTIPIFAGGGISAAERQAAYILEASLADGVAIAKKVEGEFGLVWSAFQGLVSKVDAGYVSINSAKEQFKAAELSYIHGVKTILEVANADLSLSRRTSDQINAVVEMQKYVAKLTRQNLHQDH
jgi:protease secretion system outer membrane protein